MVGRPREFDTEMALDAAMQVFWAKGYEATTLMDLMAATGLHKGSLYQAFGDKHALFIQALKRYLHEMDRMEAEELRHAKTPMEGLRNVAHTMIDFIDNEGDVPRGCMLMNAISEMAPHDSEVHKLLEDHVNQMRSTVTNALASAQASGEISAERPPEVLAGMLMTFVSGLSSTMKGYISREEAHALLDAQMEAIF
ncbi:MAG: TetR/AcrR family transcriptional regulator [Gammaproteobacteria bacterium]